MLSDPAADGVIRNQLPDDTLLVFLSDTHIGGPAGSDIFESPAELTLLIEVATAPGWRRSYRPAASGW